MSASSVLLDILGAGALLLWGLRMVTTGVSRAFGSRLRLWLSVSTRNRFSAFATGLLATLALQSSTATAVMISAFVSREYVGAAMAQAVMLGANVGTSLVVSVLALDIHWLSPLLLLSGVVLFKVREGARAHGISRAMIGLGLMLLSLSLLGAAAEPMRSSELLQQVLQALADAPLLAALLAALLALTASSSLAVVLLIMSLADGGSLNLPLILVLVAGANLGGAVPPFLATAAEGAGARRVTLTNLTVRLLGTLVVIVFAERLSGLLPPASRSDAMVVVHVHIAFNIALAIVFLPFVGWLASAASRLVPTPKKLESGPNFLDKAALETPGVALASARRETLRVGDIIHEMLSDSRQALENDDLGLHADLSKMDDQVDELQEAVKLYLSRLGRGDIDPAEARRSREIISYAINLEHIGDIIDKGLGGLIRKKARRGLRFSEEGQREIDALFTRTLQNLRIAQTVFMSADPSLARKLIESKVEVRELERASAERHLERVRLGKPDSIRTSTLHLDLLRDLKRINAHVVSVAYPILDELGELRETRLKTHRTDAAAASVAPASRQAALAQDIGERSREG